MLFSYLFSSPVSFSDIEKMATNFINQKTFEVKEPISTLQLAEYSNITIVNFHPSGFVLTSNDNQLIPVLAYSLNRNFDLLEIPIHLEMTLLKYEAEIDQLLQNNVTDNENIYLWLNLLSKKESEQVIRNVDPLLTVEWDQDPSFNLQCPYDNNGPGNHAVVGCVAVGMGQIMHYWQHPQSGIGNHSYIHPSYGLIEVDFENTNYSFSNMTDLTGNFEVQQLLFHAGVSVEMDYGPDGSGAPGGPFSPFDNPNAFSALQENFDYSNEMQWLSKDDFSSIEWLELIKDELDNGRPIAYDACANVGCHFWNIDGYENDYLHCNWGWGGQGNGFYIYSALGPDDEPIVFNSEEFMIVGIMPTSILLEGDINNDGVIDILDIIILVNMVLDDEYSSIADLNEDGELNILDVVTIVNWVLFGNDDTCIDIDGNIYETVQIGDQLWMSENLKVTHYNNGDAITHITNEEHWGSMDEGQYAVYDGEPENANIYGNLYNWPVIGDIRGICPVGWHVPSDDEYTVLTDFLGGEYVAGGKMKEAGLEHWNYYSDQISLEATNESGFTGLPAGHRNTNSGDCIYMGFYGFFWSSTENGSDLAWRRYLFDNSSGIARDTFGKPNGFSIRCLKD
tara:strand:- start:277 stop:2139 length:1863 start_codon:yes stop_codon:yes gene_type:complete